jgi:Rhodopirellula transposase DDE domain
MRRYATRSALSELSAERGRRLYAAAEVRAIGYGGLAAVARATGMSRGTIGRGLKDLDHAPRPSGRVRRDGGGRHPLSASDPTLLEDLRQLIEPITLGDPVRPLRSKSHKKLAAALQGHTVSPNTVRKLLPQLGYSRQANRKTAASIPIAMPSSSTSMPRSAPSKPTISR